MEIDARHLEAALILAQGKSHKEASEAAGVTERTIFNWCKDETFQREIDKALTTIRATVNTKAWKVVNKALEDNDTDIAKWLLDRTEFKKEDGKGVSEVHVTLGFGARGDVAPPKEMPTELSA